MEKAHSFWQDNALFASKAKINVLLKLFRVESSLRGPGVKKEFHKMLILVFEVIVQSAPKHTYEIGFFSHLGHCVLLGPSSIGFFLVGMLPYIVMHSRLI